MKLSELANNINDHLNPVQTGGCPYHKLKGKGASELMSGRSPLVRDPMDVLAVLSLPLVEDFGHRIHRLLKELPFQPPEAPADPEQVLHLYQQLASPLVRRTWSEVCSDPKHKTRMTEIARVSQAAKLAFYPGMDDPAAFFGYQTDAGIAVTGRLMNAYAHAHKLKYPGQPDECEAKLKGGPFQKVVSDSSRMHPLTLQILTDALFDRGTFQDPAMKGARFRRPKANTWHLDGSDDLCVIESAYVEGHIRDAARLHVPPTIPLAEALGFPSSIALRKTCPAFAIPITVEGRKTTIGQMYADHVVNAVTRPFLAAFSS